MPSEPLHAMMFFFLQSYLKNGLQKRLVCSLFSANIMTPPKEEEEKTILNWTRI
jgi:hypothetical protein